MFACNSWDIKQLQETISKNGDSFMFHNGFTIIQENRSWPLNHSSQKQFLENINTSISQHTSHSKWSCWYLLVLTPLQRSPPQPSIAQSMMFFSISWMRPAIQLSPTINLPPSALHRPAFLFFFIPTGIMNVSSESLLNAALKSASDMTANSVF